MYFQEKILKKIWQSVYHFMIFYDFSIIYDIFFRLFSDLNYQFIITFLIKYGKGVNTNHNTSRCDIVLQLDWT